MTMRRNRGVPADVQAFRRPPEFARETTPAPVALPEHISPPADARKLFLSAKVASVGANNSAELFSLQLGSGEEATLEFIKLFIENSVSATDVLWQVKIDGASVPGLERLTILGRAAASVEQIEDLRVAVPEGRKISVEFINVDGGAYNIGAQLTGWRMVRR